MCRYSYLLILIKTLNHIFYWFTVHLEECLQIIIKLIMHSFLSSRLRSDMWLWKGLPVFEKFENGRSPKIVWLSFDKMGSKSTIDYWLGRLSHTELLRRNEGNFGFVKMLVCVIEPRSGSFLLSSQGMWSLRCSWLMWILRCSTSILHVLVSFYFLSVENDSCIKLNIRVQ